MDPVAQWNMLEADGAWAGWPMPGRMGSAAIAAQGPAEADIVGLNGSQRRVHLLAVEPGNARCLIALTPQGGPVPMRFDQLLGLSLVAAQPVDDAASFADYRLTLTDGTLVRGRGRGCEDLPQGLLMWRLSADGSQAHRAFYARAGLKEIHCERTEGDQIRVWLARQRAKAPDELAPALDASARLALARVGSTMLALGFVDPDRLGQALAAQRLKPDLSVGELLLRAGHVTREQQRRTMLHKKGCPIVDLDRFPVDPAALRCLELVDALKFGALPIWFLEGKLVVVMDDPFQAGLLKEVAFRCRRTLLPALPLSGSTSRHLRAHYERHQLAGPVWAD